MSDSDTDPDGEFVALLTEHQLAIRLYVQSLLPGNSRARDVAQQANTTIWKKRDSFELGTNFKAWVFTICRYEVLNFRKKQARDRLVFSEELEGMFAEELPRENHNFEQLQTALRTCLGKLRQVDRDLIQHRYFNAAPLQKFADENDRSVGGLKVMLHRIRNALQKCILDQQTILDAKGGVA